MKCDKALVIGHLDWRWALQYYEWTRIPEAIALLHVFKARGRFIYAKVKTSKIQGHPWFTLLVGELRLPTTNFSDLMQDAEGNVLITRDTIFTTKRMTSVCLCHSSRQSTLLILDKLQKHLNTQDIEICHQISPYEYFSSQLPII